LDVDNGVLMLTVADDTNSFINYNVAGDDFQINIRDLQSGVREDADFSMVYVPFDNDSTQGAASAVYAADIGMFRLVNRLSVADDLISGVSTSAVASSTISQADLRDQTSGVEGNWPFDNPIPGTGGNDYAVVGTGTLQVNQAGTFSFALGGDDGGRLRIDGVDVIVDDTLHGFLNRFGDIALSAGAHTFEWVGFERGVEAEFELSVAVGAGKGGPVTAANGWQVVGDPSPFAEIELSGSIDVTAYYSTTAARASGPLPTSIGLWNRADAEVFITGVGSFNDDRFDGPTEAGGLLRTDGVLIATSSENRNVTVEVDHVGAFRSGISPMSLATSPSPQGGEAETDVATAFFPKVGDWVFGHVFPNGTLAARSDPGDGVFDGTPDGDYQLTRIGTGLYRLSIDGVDASSDGVLMTVGGSNEDNVTSTVIGSGWTVSVTDNSGNFRENDDFSFVYVPFDAPDLVVKRVEQSRLSVLASNPADGETVIGPAPTEFVLDLGTTTVGTVSTFTGGDAGDGLDLVGEFLYAVDIRGAGGVVNQTGNTGDEVTFTSDSVTPGVQVVAPRNIGSFSGANFGNSANDNVLETVARSIRWSAQSIGEAPIQINLDNLTIGQGYKLQLLFDEGCCNRGFDVLVEGQLVVDNLNLLSAEGGVINNGQAVVVTHEFVADDGQLNVVLDGTTGGAPDPNPTISGFTLEAIDSSSLDPTTVQPSDLTVNGIPADLVDLSNGNQRLTFRFNESPAFQGAGNVLDVAEGAFGAASSGGSLQLGVPAFSASFRYDAVLMEVTSTDPADGSVVLLPFTTLDLNFNEAYDLGSAEPSDFVLSQGSVVGLSQVDADTLRLSLDGITDEGALIVELDAGGMTDAFGNPGAAFSASYTLDFGTVPYPVPLTPKEPLGSLIYDPTQVGIIDPAGDTDSFTIDVDSGQLLTVVVDSDASLRSTVEIRNQDGDLIGSATAGAAGESTVLDNVPTHGQLGQIGPSSKTYTITMSGADGTTGGYNVQLILNAAVEEEGHGGPSTSNLATAQSLESTFLPLHGSVVDADEGRPERAAVLGEVGKALYSVSRVSNQLYTIDSATGLRLNQQTLTLPGGSVGSFNRGLAVDPTSGVLYGLLQTSIATDTLVTIDPATAVVTSVGAMNISGRIFGEIVFDAGGNLYGVTGGSGANRNTLFSIDKTNPATQTALLTFSTTGAGGVALNPDDGLLYRYQRNLFQSIDVSTTPPTVTTIPRSGSLPFVGQGMVYAGGGQFLLSGSGSQFYTIDTSGAGTFLGFHNFGRPHGLALVGGDSIDVYSFDLVAGESATVALTAQANMDLVLFDPSGAQLALGSSAENVSEIISNFVATTTGTHYARVTAGSIGDYSLLVTRNADFDTENNNTIATAQELVSNEVAGRHWALGHVTGAGQLLGADDGDRHLLEVDPTTGAGTILASNVGAARGFNDLARNPVTDVLYGSQSLNSQGLYTIDPQSFAETFIGNLGGNVRAMAWSPDGATLYAYRDSTFGTVDPTTAAFTSIANSGIGFVGGMAFQPGSGTLFAVTNNRGATGLYTVDVTTGAATLVGNPGSDYNSLEFLSDGTLLGGLGRFAANPGFLVELDPSTAAPTLIGPTIPFGNRNVTGLEELPATTDFYKIDVKELSTLQVETRTPARQSGEFVNNLDPMVRVYDADGSVVAEDDNGDPDGRNASLSHRVPAGAGGTYYVEVLASPTGSSSGEYTLAVKQATGALPAFQVTATDPFDGQRLRGPTTQMTVDFNDTLLLTSLDASDLTVNGTAATGLTVVDADTVVFDLPILTEGLQNVQIAGIQDIQNTPLDTFNLTFFEDLTAPRVIDSSIQENEIVTFTGDLTYTVTFDEPMRTANLDNSDFRLRGNVANVNYTPTSAGYDATGTVLTLEYGGLPEDRYTLTLFSGDGRFEDTADANGWNLDGDPSFPLPSGDGVEGGNFVVNFDLDIGTAAFPTPLTAKSPAGSLIYDPSVSGLISPSGDTDTYTINVDPGQTITVLVDPASTLQPTIELRDSGGTVLGTATAAADGQDAVLQTVPTAADTYSIVVSGAAGTTGLFSLDVTLNAALESESHNGPSNDTLATAQDINASFVPLLKGATRGAVLGTAEFAGYQQSFTEFNRLNRFFRPVFNFTGVPTASGDAILTSDTISDLGQSFEYVDYYLEGTFLGRLHGSTSGDCNRDVETLTISQALINSAGADGTLSIEARPSSGVDSFCAERHTVTMQFPTGGGGDLYSFDVAANERITLAADAQGGGNVDLALLDSGGTVLATGSTAQTNVDEMIYNFGPLAAGTYYARISGGNNTPYSLVVTEDAVFDREANDTFVTAQNFDDVVGSLGYLNAYSAISFADPSGDGVFTYPTDPRTAALTATPSTHGTLGWFSTSSLLCFGNASGNFSGNPTFDGLFNTDPSGAFSTATSFAPGALIDASAGTTGWGVVGGSGSGSRGGVTPGNHLLGFRTAEGHFGWMDVTYTNGGTSTTTDDAITINGSYINPTPGQAVIAGAIGDEDWYSVTLAENAEYSFPIVTPGDGPGEFVNTLDPKIELYDPSGTLVATGVVGGDGRNETITYTVPGGAGGLYRIRVTAEDGTSGEYFLDPVEVPSEGGPAASHMDLVSTEITNQFRPVSTDRSDRAVADASHVTYVSDVTRPSSASPSYETAVSVGAPTPDLRSIHGISIVPASPRNTPLPSSSGPVQLHRGNFLDQGDRAAILDQLLSEGDQVWRERKPWVAHDTGPNRDSDILIREVVTGDLWDVVDPTIALDATETQPASQTEQDRTDEFFAELAGEGTVEERQQASPLLSLAAVLVGYASIRSLGSEPPHQERKRPIRPGQ
jgi:hypothetical protein